MRPESFRIKCNHCGEAFNPAEFQAPHGLRFTDHTAANRELEKAGWYYDAEQDCCPEHWPAQVAAEELAEVWDTNGNGQIDDAEELAAYAGSLGPSESLANAPEVFRASLRRGRVAAKAAKAAANYQPPQQHSGEEE